MNVFSYLKHCFCYLHQSTSALHFLHWWRKSHNFYLSPNIKVIKSWASIYLQFTDLLSAAQTAVSYDKVNTSSMFTACYKSEVKSMHFAYSCYWRNYGHMMLKLLVEIYRKSMFTVYCFITFIEAIITIIILLGKLFSL